LNTFYYLYIRVSGPMKVLTILLQGVASTVVLVSSDLYDFYFFIKLAAKWFLLNLNFFFSSASFSSFRGLLLWRRERVFDLL
jgi:hypothetical protein